ncbi:MAG: hypothetical protein RMI94_01735 [Bryobacterales bacterium]|nr:hypothetical protein [Bryobacteraceae bacterium]MDW8129241.1 hypothetical protein [Bryobacterales bacterium]
MDLYEAIRALHEEKKRLDRLIAVLEELQRNANHDRPAGSKKRRGRKGMSLEERRAVSERMRRYWAQRKLQQAGAASVASPGEGQSPPSAG